MFNIYYINENKVYELAMLINNKRLKSSSAEKNNRTDLKGTGTGDTAPLKEIPFLDKFMPDVSLKGDLGHTRSKRIVDNFNIIETKSTLLGEILTKTVEKQNLEGVDNGSLIKISNLSIQNINVEDALSIKVILSGFINNIKIDELNEVNISNLFEGLLKDSAYLFYGENDKDIVMFKIPMQAESELEKGYGISDLELGKYTLVGIYQGRISDKEVYNKLNSISYLSALDKNDSSKIIETDDEGEDNNTDFKNVDVHFIDILALIQEVKTLK